MGAFNGSGTFVRSYSWAVDAANSVNISATRMDTEDNGFASGLTNCLTRDGQSVPTANLPMSSFKLTGLAAGSTAGDSVRYEQVLLISGGTLTGKLITMTSTTAAASINMPHGVSPTSPVNGDIWTTTIGLQYQISGTTFQSATTTGPETLTNKTLTSPVVTGGTVTHAAAPVANGIGYLGLPQVGKTANFTLTMADLFGEIYITGTTAAQTITIPANASVAAPIGAFAVITNDSNQNWSIAITTDTLLWSPNNTTGTRTLAAGGSATVRKVTATRWWISGTGLT